jgi:hypothetical protein
MSVADAAHFVPPYVALSQPENLKREQFADDRGHDVTADDDGTKTDDDSSDGDDSRHETEAKPMYLPPHSASNAVFRPTHETFPEFSLPGNGAVVRPLPPEVALRLQLDFSGSEVSRPKLSPAQVFAESSGASSSSVTSSR